MDKASGLLNKHYRVEVVFLFLGGDHSITYASIKALRRVSNDDFGLIYFDAHPDPYFQYGGDKYSHTCTVRRLVEEGLIGGDEVIEIGIRAPTKEQVEFAKKTGIKMISTPEIRLNPYIKPSFTKAYMSIDLDVPDSAFASGVGNPESGG